ncbi:MAG: DUF4433 domain-containing protein [Duncaniella sp.]|nr:DUF4433 domain-containing protein [Duncaniella sp.]
MTGIIQFAFRITHIDNIPHILRFGILQASSPLCSPSFVSIGDTQVITSRKDLVINNIHISDCVPFYFGPRSPMLYVIQHGYNGVRRRKPEEIVYCVIRLADIISSEIECIFSNGHALSAITKFYPKDSLSDINNIIRYEDVYASKWNNNEYDIDIKRRKEAELLINDDVPTQLICGYVVYNENAKSILKSLGITDNMIHVAPQYYF